MKPVTLLKQLKLVESIKIKPKHLNYYQIFKLLLTIFILYPK
ncbi:hypothetical protein CY0110_16952 [Crocosphaera chwakensis CCY0110]|uniref:Uncharacterized protein n=1 Tax=Crocosphaera chwakensis CCY0110 TaxID=391612 RepID=A3II72_9CHRO|nr:hypothetical protein CY0110_16952 [Crocosphaera chwakensis CCY0110]